MAEHFSDRTVGLWAGVPSVTGDVRVAARGGGGRRRGTAPYGAFRTADPTATAVPATAQADSTRSGPVRALPAK